MSVGADRNAFGIIVRSPGSIMQSEDGLNGPLCWREFLPTVVFQKVTVRHKEADRGKRLVSTTP